MSLDCMDLVTKSLATSKIGRSELPCSTEDACQEPHEVERRRGWFGFRKSLSVERQAIVS